MWEGKAKAMVDDSGRLEDDRWQLARNKYIKEKSYSLRTLVAFSGEVDDKESGPEPFKETSKELNPDLKGHFWHLTIDKKTGATIVIHAKTLENLPA